MTKIRVLSLDGGGALAGVLARTLGKLYGAETPGREIIRQFDFVAGNSGGSIVLTALCCNYTPKTIAEFYDDPAILRRLFSPKWTSRIRLLRDVLPRYSTEGKFEALKWLFDRNRQDGEPVPSTIRLQDWPRYLKSDVNLLVTAFDYDRQRAAFFRSNAGSLAKSSAPAGDPTLAEAVHASTNAPIRYFDQPAQVGGHRYWDGALAGYNNPVLAAVVETLANRPESVDDIRVLSLGTCASSRPLTTEGAAPPMGKAPDGTCLLSALKIAATVIADDPPDVASFHAHVALRQHVPPPDATFSEGHLVRICPFVRPLWDPSGGWKLPDALSAAEFEGLIGMRLDAMTRPELDLIRKMCASWFADEIPNQPIRMGDHMQCDIGHDRFSDAAAHWSRIR